MNLQIGGTYSFLDVLAAITGPGGTINIGSDAGVSPEGVTTEMIDPKNTMVIGADGYGMHSLHAGNASIWRFRILKTSPVNALLMAMYNYQKGTSAYWGQNTLSMRNQVAGDSIVGNGAAFERVPPNVNATDGGLNEWVFQCITTVHVLGDYQPILVPSG